MAKVPEKPCSKKRREGFKRVRCASVYITEDIADKMAAMMFLFDAPVSTVTRMALDLLFEKHSRAIAVVSNTRDLARAHGNGSTNGHSTNGKLITKEKP